MFRAAVFGRPHCRRPKTAAGPRTPCPARNPFRHASATVPAHLGPAPPAMAGGQTLAGPRPALRLARRAACHAAPEAGSRGGFCCRLELPPEVLDLVSE